MLANYSTTKDQENCTNQQSLQVSRFLISDNSNRQCIKTYKMWQIIQQHFTKKLQLSRDYKDVDLLYQAIVLGSVSRLTRCDILFNNNTPRNLQLSRDYKQQISYNRQVYQGLQGMANYLTTPHQENYSLVSTTSKQNSKKRVREILLMLYLN